MRQCLTLLPCQNDDSSTNLRAMKPHIVLPAALLIVIAQPSAPQPSPHKH